MDSLQKDLDSTFPLLHIQILGVNKKGLEYSNGAITDGRDLPWLQDVDADDNGMSDLWQDSWNVNYRDVVVLDGDNARHGTFNLTTNSLAKNENYEALRELLIDAAMETQKPWMNASNALDVNDDGRVQALDVLLLVNKINAEGNIKLPPPTGTELPEFFYDCSGDGLISPLDVIHIVNHLNAQSEGSGEGEASKLDGHSERVSELSVSDSQNAPVTWTEALPSPSFFGATVERSRWERNVDSVYVEMGQQSSFDREFDERDEK